MKVLKQKEVIAPKHLTLESYKKMTHAFKPLKGYVKVAYPMPYKTNPETDLIYNKSQEEEAREVVISAGMMVVELGEGTECQFKVGDRLIADTNVNIVISKGYEVDQQYITEKGVEKTLKVTYVMAIFHTNFVPITLRDVSQ